MLKQLSIKNFTLIDTLDIQFERGFSVITGETGAGKSIILGAIGLLLGQRADSKFIKSGASHCIIEAHFNLSKYKIQQIFTDNGIDYDAEDCIIRRELMDTGKSRAFINDTPVALNILKELGEHLIDIHSQHQNLLINNEDFQINVVDIIAKDDKDLNDYRNDFNEYKMICFKIDSVKNDLSKAKEEEDFIRFQLTEIDEAKLNTEEQEQLEQESETLSHAEEIKSVLYNISNTMNGEEQSMVNNLKNALNSLHSIINVYPKSEQLSSRIESCYIELKDISQEVDTNIDHIDFSPDRLDEINNKLNTIYTLLKKHHVNTITEILNIAEDYRNRLRNIDNSDDLLAQLEDEKKKILERLNIKSKRLTSLRIEAAKKAEKKMKSSLINLGMPNIRFSVKIDKKPFGTNGSDKIAFFFSANTNTPLLPLSEVASGGEIARVMLSLKAMVSDAVKLPTIIFDEIDTGVSGAIAEKMARIMQHMGESDRQVISITHLPQIAALGSSHYKVYKEETKDGTATRMIRLDEEQRIKEIAQMLSGSQMTDAAINNAKELLNQI
jgi:DNA repair protein RecN (Recombination protein N)